MKRLLSILVIMVMMIGLMPTYAAEGDIVDIASTNGSFTTLVAALQKAELVGALQGEGPFTVFAPTDEAFAKLLSDLNIGAEDLLGHPQLADVLLYHVVSGKVMSTDLSDGMKAATLQGEEIMIDLSDGVKIDMSMVSTADIEATNGVIHVIDTVLVPKAFKLEQDPAMEEAMTPKNSIVEIALGNEDFSMLVSLLQKADLVEVLQGEGPFTVFAPTNQAFDDLLKALDITAAELMAQPDLAKVLLYHVVSGKVMSSDLSNGLEAATAEGSNVKVDLTNGVKINTSNVISADIDATNGVVHVIDSILVPASFTLQEVNMNEELPKTGVANLLPAVFMGMIGLAGVYMTKKK
jgi:transforming growth factor-beta-induced protein